MQVEPLKGGENSSSAMIFVLVGHHGAEVCPTSNAKVRELVLATGPGVPQMAQRHGVRLVSGPLLNRSHDLFAVLEAPSVESVEGFLDASRLAQWNTIRIIPCQTLAEGLDRIQASEPVF